MEMQVAGEVPPPALMFKQLSLLPLMQGVRPSGFEVSPWGTFLSAPAQMISHPTLGLNATHWMPHPLQRGAFLVALGREGKWGEWRRGSPASTPAPKTPCPLLCFCPGPGALRQALAGKVSTELPSLLSSEGASPLPSQHHQRVPPHSPKSAPSPHLPAWELTEAHPI